MRGLTIETAPENMDRAIEFVDKMHEKYGCGAKEQFAICVAVDERPIGGMGILIVKKSMDAVDYEYKDGKNILTIKKNI